jgi:hypothetical protein
MDSGIEIPALPVEEIPARHRRQLVAYETDQPVGTIIINPKTRLALLRRRQEQGDPLRHFGRQVPALNGRARPSSPRRSLGRPGPRRRK